MVMCAIIELLYKRLPYLIEIIRFVSIVDIVKKYILLGFARNPDKRENFLLLESNVASSPMTGKDTEALKPKEGSKQKKAIPVGHSVMIYKIYQGLGLDAKLKQGI
ncbi:hypothetical protein NPIL_670401 [Nephila pilipes]|uniref:Uncharacterized protein n=1 Tax=Nephila pilipes TaxID=299642 RepID=A0A8X6U0N7_NEPPI|nr:hypothetical protein NPIL_670401 [Nephila pilipes]